MTARRTLAVAVALLAVAAAGSFAFAATDPIDHLDNRYEGWFSTSQGQ